MNICVFISANENIHEDYVIATKNLAIEIVEQGASLVYGGSYIGLMGVLANQALELGGEVIGVIPEILSHRAHPNLTKLHVVSSIHERKKMMTNLSDGFVIFPGGLGTLEETFEVLHAIKLKLYNKPIGFLNVNNYFDKLFQFFEHSMHEGFLEKQNLPTTIFSENPFFVINQIKAYQIEEK